MVKACSYSCSCTSPSNSRYHNCGSFHAPVQPQDALEEVHQVAMRHLDHQTHSLEVEAPNSHCQVRPEEDRSTGSPVEGSFLGLCHRPSLEVGRRSILVDPMAGTLEACHSPVAVDRLVEVALLLVGSPLVEHLLVASA